MIDDERVESVIDQIAKNLTSINTAFDSGSLRKTLTRPNIELEFEKVKEKKEATDEDNAKILNARIDEILKEYGHYKSENNKKYNSWLLWGIFFTALLPLVMSAITVGIIPSTGAIVAFLPNIIDVVPPATLTLIRGKKLENETGLETINKCKNLKMEIELLASNGKLNENLDKITEKVKQLSQQTQV